ncbi:MAG: hypothetical protein RR975_07040 [Clostridia bacterium]
MAMPIVPMEVEQILRPWLGSLFLTSNTFVTDVSARLQAYAPYRQTLESLREELESFVLTSLHHFTHGSMTVLSDNYHSRRLGIEQIERITDDIMGLVFDKLTPFSANFIKLNDYSLHVHSLAVLRVLYQKYPSYYTQEQLTFMVRMIRLIYPKERYSEWLLEDEGAAEE